MVHKGCKPYANTNTNYSEIYTVFFERMNNWLQIRDWGTNFVITLLTDV